MVWVAVVIRNGGIVIFLCMLRECDIRQKTIFSVKNSWKMRFEKQMKKELIFI